MMTIINTVSVFSNDNKMEFMELCDDEVEIP